MRHHRSAVRGLAIAFTLLVSAAFARGGPRIVPADDPQGIEVRAAAQQFWSAVADGNAAKAMPVFAGTDSHAKLLDAYLRFFTALRDLATTSEAASLQIGNSKFNPATLPEEARTHVSRSPLVLAGDQAWISEANGRMFGGTRLERVEGQWRVIGLSRSGVRSASLREQVALGAAMFEHVVAAIRAKRIATQEQLDAFDDPEMRRLQEAILRVPRVEGDAPPDCPAVSAQQIPAIANADVLSRCIGEPIRSEVMASVLDALPGLPILGTFKTSCWIESNEAGLRLSFEGSPDLKLKAVQLFAQPVEGSHAYRGQLPCGIAIGDTRADVERKLGPPGGSYGSDSYTAIYEELGFMISYDGTKLRDAGVNVREINMVKRLAANEVTPASPLSRPRVGFRLVAQGEVDMLANPEGEPAMLPVSRKVLLDESAIADAEMGFDSNNPDRRDIRLTFTPPGAEQLEAITRTNEGRQLAIVLDGRILVAPVIRGVMGKDVVISLGEKSTRKEVVDVTARLHAAVHALPSTRPATGAAKVQPTGAGVR